MKWKIRLIILLTGLLSLAIAAGYLLQMQSSGDHISSSPPTIQEIQALAELTTLKIQVADVQESDIAGQTGGIKAVIVVHGEVGIGVDLGQAKFISVDQQKRQAVLFLPQPKLLYARLDHERTKVVDLSTNGLWRIIPGDTDADAATINTAYRDAERALAKSADDQNLIRQARTQAERVLDAFFGALGWRVEIRWEAC